MSDSNFTEDAGRPANGGSLHPAGSASPDEPCPLCEAKGVRWVKPYPASQPSYVIAETCIDCGGKGRRPVRPKIQLEPTIEQIPKSSEITPMALGAFPINSPDTLAEKFLELASHYRKLQLETLQLQHEVAFAIRLIQMQPNQDRVIELVAKRLGEALQKFKVEDIP
jgi:hypothetical protein